MSFLKNMFKRTIGKYRHSVDPQKYIDKVERFTDYLGGYSDWEEKKWTTSQPSHLKRQGSVNHS